MESRRSDSDENMQPARVPDGGLLPGRQQLEQEIPGATAPQSSSPEDGVHELLGVELH